MRLKNCLGDGNMSILDKIDFHPLDADQYYHEKIAKKQIYLHHTASNPDPYGVLRWWNHTPEIIATAFIIGGSAKKNDAWKDGSIVQVFNSSYWAWHLGLKREHLAMGGNLARPSKELNQISIGIEICNWGYLTESDNGFKSYAGVVVPDAYVVELDQPYRGHKYYQKYTDAQLETTRELVYYLCNKWSIPTMYKGDDMFDIDARPLQGDPGIWTHTSVRPDKTDCFPQKELVEMLRSL